MKSSIEKAVWMLLLVCMAMPATAQQTDSEGVITYEERVDIHRRIPEEQMQYKSMVPQFRTGRYELFFSPGESHFKPVEEDDISSGSGGVKVMMRRPEKEMYTDVQTGESITQQEFMGKVYLIVDTLGIDPWKFGDEKREIAGYECRMAYYNDTVNRQDITVWFTPLIHPFVGPDRFSRLPGTVLAVDINNGEVVYVAREVTFRSIRKREIRKPVKGERVSPGEFRRKMDEHMEKTGGRGGVMRYGH
jgi:GLPGLI family protein